MSTLERLIQHLPLYFDHDPAFEAALTVGYDGLSGEVSIVDRQLIFRVSGGIGTSLTIPLVGRSVAQIAQLISLEPGYRALVREGHGGDAAEALFDVQGDVTHEATLSVYTSLLWRVLAPIAWALDTSINNLAAGRAQMALPTAGGPWVDLWGDIYGGILRRSAETDSVYAARIMREVRRLRLTIPALTQVIEDELGVHVEIRNLHEDAWIIAETRFGILAGRRHARTTFEVRVDRTTQVLSAYFDAQLRYLVDRNKAAGTLPFYVSVNRGGNDGTYDSVKSIGKGFLLSTVRLSTPLTWIIGEGQLGQQWLSLAANVGAAVTVTTRAPSGEGDVLIVGDDRLGLTQLGEA